MSYSRWGGSRWYTYRLACCGECCDEQIFEICDFGDEGAQYTYAAIRERGADVCAQQHADEKHGGDVTPEEVCELAGYMRLFVEDVDAARKAQEDE